MEDDILKKINTYFSYDELKCHCGECPSDGKEMNLYFMQKIYELRKFVNSPFYQVSAYRCPDYNDKISRTGKDGPHTFGRAIDFTLKNMYTMKLMEGIFQYLPSLFKKQYIITGIGIKDKKNGLVIIHLDDLTDDDDPKFSMRPNLWIYGSY